MICISMMVDGIWFSSFETTTLSCNAYQRKMMASNLEIKGINYLLNKNRAYPDAAKCRVLPSVC